MHLTLTSRQPQLRNNIYREYYINIYLYKSIRKEILRKSNHYVKYDKTRAINSTKMGSDHFTLNYVQQNFIRLYFIKSVLFIKLKFEYQSKRTYSSYIKWVVKAIINFKFIYTIWKE